MVSIADVQHANIGPLHITIQLCLMCLSVIKWPLIHGYIFFLAKNPSKKQNDSPKLLMFVKYTDTHYTLYSTQP